MTRFELAKKGFADPLLRPLTHIALKKYPGRPQKEKDAHTPVLSVQLYRGRPDAGEKSEGYGCIKLCAKLVVVCCSGAAFCAARTVTHRRRQAEGSGS